METRRRRKDISFPLTLILVGLVALWIRTTHGDWTLWRLVLLLIPVFVLSGGVNLAAENRRFAAAVVVTAAGAALLAQGLGLIQWSAWGLVARAWPLAVVALGIDLALDRTSALRVLLGLLAGVGLVIVAFLAFGEREEPAEAGSSRRLTYPVGEAQAALVVLRPAWASMEIGGAPESASLLEVSISPDPGSSILELYEQQGARAEIRLEATGTHTWFWPTFLGGAPRWTAELAGGVPTDLEIDIGAGSCDLDLSELEVRSLTVHLGLGECTIVLPSVADLQAEIDSAMGQVELVVPPSIEARFQMETALTTTSISGDLVENEDEVVTPGYTLAADRAEITVNQAIGSVVIRRR